jgi:hypothetical protein
MSIVRRGSVSGLNPFRNRSNVCLDRFLQHSAPFGALLCGDVLARRATVTELSIKLDTVTGFEPNAKVFVPLSKAEEAFDRRSALRSISSLDKYKEAERPWAHRAGRRRRCPSASRSALLLDRDLRLHRLVQLVDCVRKPLCEGRVRDVDEDEERSMGGHMREHVHVTCRRLHPYTMARRMLRGRVV